MAHSAGDVIRGNGFGPHAFSLLQQELIGLRARLDRQSVTLARLNRFSNRLISLPAGREALATFAEAILDVLDLPVGAVWVLQGSLEPEDRFAVAGVGGAVLPWADAGLALLASLPQPVRPGAVPIPVERLTRLRGLDLEQVMLCPCFGRDGSVIALLLAALTPTLAGMVEPLSDDGFEVLAFLAEKVDVHLDHGADQRLIQDQIGQLQQSEQRLQRVLRGTNDGWWDWDLNNGSCFLSARWRQMLGCGDGRDDAVGRFWRDRLHPEDVPLFERHLERALAGVEDSVECELRLRRDDGHYLPVLMRGTLSLDRAGHPDRFAGSIFDLTERKRHEAHVHRLAFYDSLTDLPNRLLLIERIELALQACSIRPRILAVLMIDLDRFKLLNDTHGHAAGDQLLAAVGQRLRGCLRSHDTVARLGGDEFVVVLEDLGRDVEAAGRSAEDLANRLLNTLHAPFQIDVGISHHSASIGITLVTEPAVTVELLLQRADVALYAAKAAGRNTVRLFRPEMQQQVDRRSALETLLRGAITNQELAVVFQAQVDAHGQIYGAEALMRWHPQSNRSIPPAEFIPVAVESGLIDTMGAWFLEQVCRQLSLWEPALPEEFRVAVNLSKSEFLHPAFAANVVQILERTGVSGRRLRLEITEESVLRELDLAAQCMHLLRSQAIEFSLDDFGTGYSSLPYLRQLPVSELKIDRSYVRSFPEDRNDAAIVRAVLSLAAALELRVVAEGVETVDQYQALVDAGCPCFQGYLFGRPMAATDDPGQLVSGTLPWAIPGSD